VIVNLGNPFLDDCPELLAIATAQRMMLYSQSDAFKHQAFNSTTVIARM